MHVVGGGGGLGKGGWEDERVDGLNKLRDW